MQSAVIQQFIQPISRLFGPPTSQPQSEYVSMSVYLVSEFFFGWAAIASPLAYPQQAVWVIQLRSQLVTLTASGSILHLFL